MSIVYSFEQGIPDSFTSDAKSRMNISKRHYKDGNSSLKWEFEKNSQLNINAPIGYKHFVEGSLNKARDTFAVFIYSECESSGKLNFSFSTKGITNCYFDMNMKFTGWRTVWVQYERDMTGAPDPLMDNLCITAKDMAGTIYIDQMVLCVPVDPRHPVRDYQVPFVNLQADKAANSHWMSMYRFSQLQKNAIENAGKKDENRDEFSVVLKRYDEFLKSRRKLKSVSPQEMHTIKEKYSLYKISYDNGVVTGTTIDAACQRAIYPKDSAEELLALTNPIDIKDCAAFLLDIAYAYIGTEAPQFKDELGNIFVNVTRQLIDQGWAEGSGMGTPHHLGYPMRNYYWAMFLMRDILSEAGLIEIVQKAMSWFSGSGRIFRSSEELKGESIDTLNTLAQGMLASILLMKNEKEKAVCLKAYGFWLSRCLLPAPGLRGPFKIDGSAFHHCNHYPAYALGGFTGITPVIYFISGTAFAISQAAHETVKKALLMLRVYSNHYNWLVSMSSRHPVGSGEHSGISTLVPFKYMALAGTPDGSETPDPEVAAAYLRLAEPIKDEGINEFKNKGIIAEKAPTGHWNLNYAAAALHRRGEWLAGVRGHSRYLWANETYLNANLYGRYITHGHLQILSRGEPVNNTDSGYVQKGWDFNCWPGTTTIHLPIDLLKSDVRNVDIYSGFEEMLLSEEAFAGGTSMDDNGVFAMKLHEHQKYNGSHKARKSWFFFDNRIVCIGTDIENTNCDNPTITTLFQNHMKDVNTPIWINDLKGVTGIEYDKNIETDKPVWILDNIGNGYYVYGGQNISIFRSHQHSKAQNNGEDTEGDFAKAWLNHGYAPEKGDYSYTIVVDTNAEKMQKLAEEMTENAPHTILNSDTNKHIVRDNLSNMTAYAIFEPCENIEGGVLASVDTPSLIMEKLIGDTLKLSICDPDLRLYEGKEADQYDENGNYIEVSLYSRKWRSSDSKKKTLRLSLKGKWNVNEAGYRTENSKNHTEIYIPCKDGLTTALSLTKVI